VLRALLSPASIAILGASADLNKVNGRTLRFLLAKGYAGRILPVNPKYPEIAGVHCYPDVAALPDGVDLAVVAVPAALVPGELEKLGRRGIGAAVVFSSGFGESGADGRAAEARLAELGRRHGIRICGPNCLGLINAFDNVIATFGQFAEGPTPAGPVGFVTQSGAFGTAIAALARRRGIGLGYFVNTGNEADVGFVEVMGAVLADPRIRVGAGYIEGLKDGAGLVALAQEAMRLGKPLVVTKVGRTASGAKAAASHTGSLAGEDAVFDGIVRQYGIIRARNEEHMLDIVEVLAGCGAPDGRGVAIVTQSGGAGVLMADRCEELGLTVTTLGTPAQERLRAVIPGFGTTANPVDITGQFISDPTLLTESVRAVLDDPGVHVGIVWLQLMDAFVDRLVAIFAGLRRTTSKPFVVCWVAAPDDALDAMRALGIPVLRGAEPAVDAVAALVAYAAAARRLSQKTGLLARSAATDAGAGELPRAGGPVPSMQAAAALASFGVPLAGALLARTPGEATAMATALGYPVALKIESPDILHKTEAGGVRLALSDPVAVTAAWTELMRDVAQRAPDARIEGALVQSMARGDVELVVGLKRDPVFGVVVMVGLGGIFIEVLKDVAFRRAPVSRAEADEMLDELRGRVLLDGVRGRPAVDRAAVADLICAVSRFGAARADRIEEVDLNPVFAGAQGVVAVDWLLVLTPPVARVGGAAPAGTVTPP
jgi:acetyltransferase